MHFRDLAIQNNKNEISCVIERPFSFAKTEPFLEGVRSLKFCKDSRPFYPKPPSTSSHGRRKFLQLVTLIT